MSSPSLSTTIATQGFHFTLSTTVDLAAGSAFDYCALHVVYDLDSHVYADQYELAQRLDYTSHLWGTSDLERPVSAVDADGSVLLLTVDALNRRNTTITLDVPLHARYGRPVADSDFAYHEIVLRHPTGFFACASDEVTPVPDALQSYASLQGWPTSPMSVIPNRPAQVDLKVEVPVGNMDDLAVVDIGTAVVVITLFFYLLFASLRTARRLSSKPFPKTD